MLRIILSWVWFNKLYLIGYIIFIGIVCGLFIVGYSLIFFAQRVISSVVFVVTFSL